MIILIFLLIFLHSAVMETPMTQNLVFPTHQVCVWPGGCRCSRCARYSRDAQFVWNQFLSLQQCVPEGSSRNSTNCFGAAVCWSTPQLLSGLCTRALSHEAYCSCCWLSGGRILLEDKAENSQLPAAFQLGEQPWPFLCRCTGDLHFQETFGLLYACR